MIVDLQPRSLGLLGTLLPPARRDLLVAQAARAHDLLAGRVVWNVSATAEGGGVAEMLHTLLGYARDAGVDTRWWVLEGDPEFFAITKRVHNALHGVADPSGGLADREHAHYERVLARNQTELAGLVRPGDVVLLHDPQTAGLVGGLRALGALVVWRCHIGRDTPDAASGEGWAFLRPYLAHADALVFSRGAYAPDWVAAERVGVITPSIDPFSTKNRELRAGEVDAVLGRVGLVGRGGGDDRPPPAATRFTARDGTVREVRRHGGLMVGAPVPPAARLVVQVSRWDRLKDMAGVMAAFAEGVVPVRDDVHLVLAGPEVSGVSDDPEGAEVLAECRAAWARLPGAARGRCHLVCLPMDDVDENATIVNALQRRATVVVQKSLQEGFGLTVTEAMWKGRPVLVSAVGGILDQVVDGEEGLLLPDPLDLDGFTKRLLTLLDGPVRARQVGRQGRRRVRDQLIGDRHLIGWLDLVAHLLAHPA